MPDGDKQAASRLLACLPWKSRDDDAFLAICLWLSIGGLSGCRGLPLILLNGAHGVCGVCL